MQGKKIAAFGLYLWQLPQHLLGLLLILMLKGNFYQQFHSARVYTVHAAIGISLGQYIIMQGRPGVLAEIPHEWGHSRQSLRCGPLYVLIIGLPSVSMNILSRMRILRWDSYYKRWPENWADRLGGVSR